jgi:O-antigen/teichoic acid export membrane protein
MTKITNIAKNTSYLTMALVIQKIISFTYFAILARNIGPENLGKYYFAISFTTIFSIFIDFGLINVLTREIAKRQEKAKEILGSVLAIKIVFTVFVFLAIFLSINLLNYPEITKQLVYLSSICIILDSFTMSYFGTIRAFHDLKFESFASIIFQLVVMSFGLFFLYSGYSLVFIMSALVLASLFNFIYSSLVLHFKWRISILPKFKVNLIKKLLILAIPFALYAIFQRLYMYFDTVLLSIFTGDAFVGYYQIPFKIVFALQFLPLAFTASLYPAMSSYWLDNKDQLVVTFERAVNYLIIISFPIAVGIIVLAGKIMLLFNTGYEEAIIPLQIIMMALIFLFVNYPIGSLLNACDKQRQNTINMAIVAFVSLALNLILIPRMQAIGASITVLVTNFLMVALGFYWVPKIIPYRPKKILVVFLKAMLSAMVMGLAVFYLKTYLNIFIVVIVGGIVYFLTMFIVRGFTREDVLSIYKIFIKNKSAN